MLSSAILLRFITTCLIVESTPGPNMGYLALLSITAGRRAGFITVAGIMLGLLGLGVAAAFGLATLMIEFPQLYDMLRWAGVAYLLWLAWDAWRTPPMADAAPETGAPASNARYFRRGLITNLLNPKAAAFYFTLLPQFMDANAPHPMQQTLLLTAISVIIATSVHGLIVLAAAQLAPWITHPRYRRITQRVFALLLAAIALWLGYSTRH